MAAQNGKGVVVTGVSTGIGRATARALAAAGYHVFGSVRRQQDADEAARELGTSYTPLLFDVTDAAAVAAGVEAVRRELGNDRLAGLVNNAGVAVPGPLLEVPVEDFRRQIEINLVSVHGVTRAFFPLLRTLSDPGGRPARIITIGSVSGLFGLPLMGPYVASKFGIEGLMDSLRRECMLFGIHVALIEPGRIATPIWDKADRIDIASFAGSPYIEAMKRLKAEMVGSGQGGLPVERVSTVVLQIMEARRPRARYSVGAPRGRIWMSRHEMTNRMVDRMIARRLGLTPPA